MKLFEVEETTTNELDTIGVVADQIGAKGKIVLDVNNLKREDKLVMVDLINEQGKKQRVYCSAALSEQVRKTKMPKQDLINYLASLDIAVTTNNDGEERFKIILRQGAKIEGSVTATVAPQASVLVVEEIPW